LVVFNQHIIGLIEIIAAFSNPVDSSAQAT